eukprot:2153911-Rhodomonas_salina.2
MNYPHPESHVMGILLKGSVFRHLAGPLMIDMHGLRLTSHQAAGWPRRLQVETPRFSEQV